MPPFRRSKPCSSSIGMTGRDAAVTAKRAFPGEALPATGVVLTKTDGDGRGGAALSIRLHTGQAGIKFIGTGEDRMASTCSIRRARPHPRLGDVPAWSSRSATRPGQGEEAGGRSPRQAFDLNDMRDQLEQMQNMGGLRLMDKLPGVGASRNREAAGHRQREIPRMIAIINSMTKKERLQPDLLNARGARVAGSGRLSRRQQGAEAVPADGKMMGQAQPRRHEGHDARSPCDWDDGQARRHAFPLT